MNIFIADQSDREMWRKFRKRMRRDNIKFDVILDDGAQPENPNMWLACGADYRDRCGGTTSSSTALLVDWGLVIDTFKVFRGISDFTDYVSVPRCSSPSTGLHMPLGWIAGRCAAQTSIADKRQENSKHCCAICAQEATRSTSRSPPSRRHGRC